MSGTDFRAAFKALTGNDPFRWQERLFARFAEGDLPGAVDIPTGLGKTSIMAIWLAALDVNAPLSGRLPRRLIYVVDRRTVVDQATAKAEKLKKALDEKRDEPAIAAVRARLGLEDKQPLPVSTLRGQFADNRAWLDDISRPAIVVGTVDMIGSRLLFSGYNVSRGMRPVHAALIGTDALIVLDEAHLVPPFQALVEQVKQLAHDDGKRSELPARSMHLTTLSATGRETAGESFKLEAADVGQDENVRQRLDAPKWLKLEPEVAAGKLAETLAGRAWERAGAGETPVRVIVFCHGNKVARDVHALLTDKLKALFKARGDKTSKPENYIELIVGARRVREREEVTDRTVFKRFANKLDEEKKADAETMPAFIVANAAGEVGVDMDADHMVSDLVAWERMVQRLGRVNRFGLRTEGSLVDVFPAPADGKDADSPILDENLTKWRAPFEHGDWAEGEDSRRNASPAALRALRDNATFAAVTQKATTPPPLRPALTRAHVDAWSMTSLKAHTGRADVAPWIRGWVEEQAQTTLVWRRLLPVRDDDSPAEARRQLDAFFEVAPPHLREGLETYTSAAAELMSKRAKDVLKRLSRGDDEEVDEERDSDDEGDDGTGADGAKEQPAAMRLTLDSYVAVALASDRSVERMWTLRELAATDAKRIYSAIVARTVVLHAALGGLTEAGLIEPGTKGRAIRTTLDDETSSLWDEEELQNAGFRVRLVKHVEAPLPDWRIAYQRIVSSESEESGDEDAQEWRVEQWFGQGSRRNAQALSKFDQYLDDHHRQATEKAKEICNRLDLPDWLSAIVISMAGIHDTGKARKFWQRYARNPLFGRDPNVCALAKFKKRSSPGLLKIGDDIYRHEFGSLLDAMNALPTSIEEKHHALALHMLAAHHGNGRPTITPADEKAPSEKLASVAREQLLRFHALQIAWGPWGLVWLEALLRAADAQASRKLNETGEGKAPDAAPYTAKKKEDA